MVYENGQTLAAHLHSRHPPLEKEDIRSKIQKVQEKFEAEDTKVSSNDDLETNRNAIKYIKTLLYNWAPLEYNKYASVVYLVSRSVAEYSVLYKIFKEILNNDEHFVPKTLFDYGSGIGTVMW